MKNPRLEMITPIRGRKITSSTQYNFLNKRLEMITPIRGRKITINVKIILCFMSIRNDNPDKGTEEAL